MKLSVVIPCTDTKGAFTAFQSLVVHHKDIAQSIEILIVGAKAEHEWLAKYVQPSANCNFINVYAKKTPAYLINTAIAMAANRHVLCVQPDCFIEPGVIERLIEYYNFNYDSDDLIQGPLSRSDSKLLQVKPWMAHDMLTDVSKEVSRGIPFPIGAQSLGVFSCRRDAWPGINGLFKVSDGSGYIHDKFRRRGNKCMCLPWFNWSCPPIMPASSDGLAHDFSLWFAEEGRDPREMFDQLGVEYVDAIEMYRRAGTKHKLMPIQHRNIAIEYRQLVSCFTIVGDASDYALNECLESFRRQTYPGRELIIVNDNPDRSICVDMPSVKVVIIPGFSPETALEIANGDFICMWPPDRVPYPTKLSRMMVKLKDGCCWGDQCMDMNRRPKTLPPTFMATRSAFASAAKDFDNFDDMTSMFAQLPTSKMVSAYDIAGDTTCPWEKGSKLYQLAPSWGHNKYEKIAVEHHVLNRECILAFVLMENLLEWPLEIIYKLRQLGLRVILIDQNSTYQPLLSFYDDSEVDVRVLPGPLSRSEFILNSGIPAEFCEDGEFYLVSDNDIDISNLPADIVRVMIDVIGDYGGPAAGLRASSYNGDIQPRYWDKPGHNAMFPFTMYRLGSKISGVPQKEVPDHVVRHLPDELDIESGLSEELLYYLRQRIARTSAANDRVIDAYLGLVEKAGDDS